MYRIKAGKIFQEDGEVAGGCVVVKDGVIMPEAEDGEGCETIDLGTLTLCPGLIDIHVHGGGMFDTMDLSYEAINGMSVYKAKEGTTAFCPTTVTSSLEKTRKAVENVRDAMRLGVGGAKVLGSFLEGPYVSPAYKGAHPEEYIREINITEIDDLIKAGDGTVVSFAIAPDLPGAGEAIAYLRGKGVNVRVGHTAATRAQAAKAIEDGAEVAIHTFNAMSPFTHREPGMAGEVLVNDGVYAEIICDLIHVHPGAVQVLLKCKGTDKVVLITDCMMAGGAPDGNYMLGELPVIVNDGVCRLESGALAGSTLTMNRAVKNMVETLGVPAFEAVKMASLNPAKVIGIDKLLGSIKPGKRADLVGFDSGFNARFVMVDGKIIINSNRTHLLL